MLIRSIYYLKKKNIYMDFKLPIQYIHNYKLSKTIKDDIEMNPCYQKIIGNSSLLEQWTSYYTTNKTI